MDGTTSSTSKIQLKGHVDYVNDLKENTHKKQLFQKINNNKYSVIN